MIDTADEHFMKHLKDQKSAAMGDTTTRSTPAWTGEDPLSELRRGFAVAALVVCAVPAVLAAFFGSIGSGLSLLAASTVLAAFAWKRLIEPHTESLNDRAIDAQYRLDDADRRLATAAQELDRSRRLEFEASRLAGPAPQQDQPWRAQTWPRPARGADEASPGQDSR